MLVKVTRNVSLHSYVPNYAKITSTEPIYWTNWLNDTSCSQSLICFNEVVVIDRPNGSNNSLKNMGNSVIGSNPLKNQYTIVLRCCSDFQLILPLYLSSFENSNLTIIGNNYSRSSSASFGILSFYFCYLAPFSSSSSLASSPQSTSQPCAMTRIISLNLISSQRPSSSFWYFGSFIVLLSKSCFLEDFSNPYIMEY